jgi:hypothetical protein
MTSLPDTQLCKAVSTGRIPFSASLTRLFSSSGQRFWLRMTSCRHCSTRSAFMRSRWECCLQATRARIRGMAITAVQMRGRVVSGQIRPSMGSPRDGRQAQIMMFAPQIMRTPYLSQTMWPGRRGFTSVAAIGPQCPLRRRFRTTGRVRLSARSGRSFYFSSS